MKVYHGSYMAVPNPLVHVGRACVDFGRGFYLTKLREQAESWAKTVAGRRPGRKAMLSIYELNLESIAEAGFRHRAFDQYDMAWLDYVIDCRHGGKASQEYDLVEGGVANDKVIDTVEDYENGVITAEQALGRLAYQKVNHQLCILSQEIVNRFLVFESSEEVLS